MDGQHRKVWGFSVCLYQKCWRQFRSHQCPIPRQRRGKHWTGRGPSCLWCWTDQLWICPPPPSVPVPWGVSKEERRCLEGPLAAVFQTGVVIFLLSALFTCNSWLTSMLTLGRDTATAVVCSLPIHVSSCFLLSDVSSLGRVSTL